METTTKEKKVPPMKPATLLLWIVVAIGTSLLANIDFGQSGARAANPQEQVRDVILPEPTQKQTSASQQQPTKKSKTQTFDTQFQVATNYYAQEGIGLRWSQHFYDNPLDMTFKDGLQHLEESKARRLRNIQKQVEGLYKPDENEAFPEFKVNLTTPIYLSHVYYKTKWDTTDQDGQALASAQNGYISTDAGTCSQPAEVSDDMDLTKKRILSNRVKMGLSQMGTKEEQLNLRQSSIMSLAFGWTPSCELPVDRIERNENEQIIEETFSKMAKTHHIQNYHKYVDIFSAQEMSGSRNVFSRSFYTVDHGTNHPAAKLGGIIEGVHAKDISNLTKSKSPRAATFFGQRVDIQPNFINFNQIQILKPEQMKFTIENIDTQDDIIINDVFTSTPELLIYPPKGVSFPVTLRAGKTMTFTCLIAAETWGMIQGSVTVAFDAEFMFMLPVTAFSTGNDYEIEPVYYSNVNVGEQVNGYLKLKNPSATEELEIIELYSTEDYFKLYWPNQVQVASPSEAQSNRDFSKYLRIDAGAKAKTILTYRFETDQAIDHRVIIHMLTSRGDVLRIPFYFHVYTDLVKFTPSIADFGIIPFRFDPLKIPVSVSMRNGVDSNVLYLTEVLLPMQDKRLDFVMGAWDRESYGNIQVLNKNTRRLEEQRRGVIQRDKQLHLFTIILNPTEFGPIDTNIVLIFNTDDGNEFRVDLPIIGFVLPTSHLLTENDRRGTDHFQPWSIAKPAIRIDVSHQLNDPTLNSPQLLKSKRVEERLILANTLGTDLRNFEVINIFPDSIFTYFSGSSSRQGVSSKTGVIAPGQTIQLGAFILNLKDLKTTSGRYYSFVHVNGNLFLPIAIQITDNRLLCSYQPDDYQVALYKDCQSGLNLDFGNIVPYQPKHKLINMTNIGSEPVQIDWLTRTVLEIQVRFLSFSPPLNPGQTSLGSIGEWTSEELKQRLSYWIQPQQTLTMQVTVEPTQRTMMGASEILSKQLLSFQFIPRAYSEFNVSVSFRAHDGTIQFLPKRRDMSFGPAFVGQEKHEQQILSFKSNLKRDVLIKSISVDDPRFKISIINAKLANQTEVLKVVFDPNQRPVAASVAVGVKNSSDQTKILQRITNQDSQATTKNQDSQTSSEYLPISIKDITKLRYTQESLFKNRKESESKLVEATLTVETDFVSPIKYKLTGVIVPPEIINTTKIDFGKVALGSSVSAPIFIQNPFNDTMKVQMFVGRRTLQIENELRRLKLLSITEDPILNSNSDNNQPNEKFAEKLLHELHYTDFYCFKVLSISTDNKILAESTSQSSRQWQLNNEWLDEYEDAVFLDRDSPKDLVCAGMLKILAKYQSREEFEVDKEMWLRIDRFFREVLVANINLQTNINSDSVSYDYLNSVGVISQIESLIDQLVKGNEHIAQLDQHPKPVDQEVLDDMLLCSTQRPLLEVNQTNARHITQQIAFPNVIDYYLPLRPFLNKSIWIISSPLRWTFQILKGAYYQQGVINQAQTIFNEAFSGFFQLFQSSLISKKKSKLLRPEDFLLQRARDRNFQPAATITNQFQFSSDNLHEQILKNNGTIGVERNIQNFYLNAKYFKTFTIPPLQELFLTDAIIFEPRVLSLNDQEPLQMSLYIKTDKLGLQKIDLVGHSSTSLLELSEIRKIIKDQKDVDKVLVQKLSDIPTFCDESDQGPQYSCMNTSAHNSYLAQQLVGRSTLTPLISLKIDLRDVLMSQVDSESNTSQFLSSTFTRLLKFVGISDSNISIDSIPKLADEFYWFLKFDNVGNADFNSLEVGFEDSVTGEISCQSGELIVQPCSELIVPAQKSQVIRLRMKSDYSTAVYKKTLVFKSVGHIQRFPLFLNTDSQILDLANQLNDSSHEKELASIVLILLSLASVGLLLKQSHSQRQQKPVQGLVRPKDPTSQVEGSTSQQNQVVDQPKVQTIQEPVKVQDKKVIVQHESTKTKKSTNSSKSNQKQQPIQSTEEEIKVLETKLDQPKQSENTQETPQSEQSKTKQTIEEAQVETITELVEPKQVVEKQPQTASSIRMSKREKRALEQKKREAEILQQTQTDQDVQPAQNQQLEQNDPQIVAQEQQIVQTPTLFGSSNLNQNQEYTNQPAKSNQITPETIVEKNHELPKAKRAEKDVRQDLEVNQIVASLKVSQLDSSRPAPPVQEKSQFLTRVDSPRPGREKFKKAVTDQIEVQLPMSQKKPEELDQPKYKRVHEQPKVTEDKMPSEATQLKQKPAITQITQSQVAKPIKVEQQTVASNEITFLDLAERRSSQPPFRVEQKSQAISTLQSISKPTSIRTVIDKNAENLNERGSYASKNFSVNFTYKQQNQSIYQRQASPPQFQDANREQYPTNLRFKSQVYQEKDQRRNNNYLGEVDMGYQHNQYSQLQQRNNQQVHAYHRNHQKSWDFRSQNDHEDAYYDEEDQYNLEEDQPTNDNLLRNYQKRNYAHMSQEINTPKNKQSQVSQQQTKPQYTPKPMQEKSTFVQKNTYQPVYQPKKQESQVKTFIEPVVVDEDLSLKVRREDQNETQSESQLQVEQNEQKQPSQNIAIKMPENEQDSVKADSFYNAFKTVRSIFSKKTVIQDEEEKVTVQQEEASAYKPVTNMSNQGFSLFSNSVFARDTKANMQNQNAFEFQKQSQREKVITEQFVPQPNRQLFRQTEDYQQVNLTDSQLRQQNDLQDSNDQSYKQSNFTSQEQKSMAQRNQVDKSRFQHF